MRSKRQPVRGARAQGDSACREMHGRLPQACEGRQTAENMYVDLRNPRSALVRVPLRRGWCPACANEGVDEQITTRPSIWSTLQRRARTGTLI